MAPEVKQKYAKLLGIMVAIIVLFVLVLFLMVQNGDIIFLKIAWRLFATIWWIVLPIPMWKLFMEVWGEYTVLLWAMSIKKVLLEIIPPSDVEKSPKIMEQAFNGIHSWTASNLFERYCGWRPGQDRYSFEIVSTEGRVHFYVRCPKVARNNIESQIYAQYPDAEIFEVEDYTNNVPKNLPNPNWDLWGSTLRLTDNDSLPIRTYKNFIEDVTGKMIDPLASLTEVMSAIGTGQHIWLQIVIDPIREDMWHPQSREYIDELVGKNTVKKKKGFFNYLGEIGILPGNVIRGFFTGELIAPMENSEDIINEFNINKLTPGEQEKVKAVYDNISKPGFKTSIRFVYLGKREQFNKALGVAGVMGSLKQFANVNLNSIFPDPQSKTFANYYFTDSRLTWRQRRIVRDYRDRAMTMRTFTFNTEELASIFHFPDMSVKAPNLTRIEAKKGEAPSNLPIGFEPEPSR